MSQSRFLSCILTEGCLLLLLGLCILILPKILSITFGSILSFTFISYGGYKIINGCLIKNLSGYIVLNIISGSLLTLSGLMLMLETFFPIAWTISILAIFFIVNSLSTSAFTHRTRNFLFGGKILYLISIMQFIFGLMTIAILPSYAFWLAGLWAGIDFLVSGFAYINLYYLTKT